VSNTSVCDIQDQTVQIQTMFCNETTQYNDMASLLWTPPNVALPLLYHRDTGSFSLLTLGIFTVIYFLLSVISAGLFMAGGLFIPMMLVGGAMGRFVGTLLFVMFPNVTPPIDPSIYALMGSAAVMTGFCRMTISLVVILVELTEGTQYLLPIILAVMLAKWVGDYCSVSIYHRLIEMKGLPFLEGHPPKGLVTLGVVDFMETNVITFGEVEKISTIYKALCETKHHGFPVVESGGKHYRGLILRSHLLVLLQRKAFTPDPKTLGTKSHTMPYAEFASFLMKKLPHPTGIFLSDEELEMFVDLRPYMNNSAVTINTSFSFGHTYSLFRTMGLRHLPVLDEEHRVVGIITRKDLL